MTQATHNPALFYLIQTREAFEARLRTMQGLEFMVAHDPSDNGTKVEHSGIWVIRRQIRRKRAGTEDEITPISSFYVVGENIYMASSLGSVLGARLVCLNMDRQVCSSCSIPVVARHCYLVEQSHCNCVGITILYSSPWSHLSPSSSESLEPSDKQRRYSCPRQSRFDLGKARVQTIPRSGPSKRSATTELPQSIIALRSRIHGRQSSCR